MFGHSATICKGVTVVSVAAGNLEVKRTETTIEID